MGVVCDKCDKRIKDLSHFVMIKCLQERSEFMYHRECFFKLLGINFTAEDLSYFISFKTDIEHDWS